ncbi:MAG: alpha/beta hydrolase [Thaumarchaeota archaeon]|nr:alpha/beta hydrolase [Nitrososphaerota archaeon]
MPGSFLRSGEVETYYEVYGEGKPLVMLHGDSYNIENFTNQVPYLSDGFRLILPERRGHGRTPDVPGPWTYGVFAKDTVAFLDALGLNGVHLLGHSGGANIALLVAIWRPDLVDRLIPVSGDAPSYALTEEQKNRVRSRTVEDFRKQAPFIVESNERITPDGVKRFPAMYEKSKGLWTTDWKVTPEQLGSIRSPTMVMLADRDFGPIEEAAAVSRMIPNAQLCVVPRATHGLMRMRSEVVNPIIMDFLTATLG